jgi:hypothetical protein
MEFKVETNDAHLDTYITALLPSFFKQLGLENSTRFVYITIDHETEEDGSTYRIHLPEDEIDGFVVTLNGKKDLIHTTKALAHELVHVRQYAKGYLKEVECGVYSWCGKVFPKETPYLDRPWEIDALSREEILTRRALEV